MARPIFTVIILLVAVTWSGCRSIKPSPIPSRTSVDALADSLLRHGLDHEALYSLLDSIKPMSSLLDVAFTFEPRTNDSIAVWHAALRRLEELIPQRFFFMVPFRRADSMYRTFATYVVHPARWVSCIQTYAPFFIRHGIYPTTSPVQAVSIVEAMPKADRWRSYGYLFGYPNDAVDFFVDAGIEQDSTRQFVPRDFRQIPVFAGPTGHFVYAVPKGRPWSASDSTLLFRSTQVLDRYKQLRPQLPLRLSGFSRWTSRYMSK